MYVLHRSTLFRQRSRSSDPLLDHLDPKADYDDSNTMSLHAISQSSRKNDKDRSTVPVTSDSHHNLPPQDPKSQSHQPESEPASAPSASDPAEFEEEASSEGAFNPVTGEINWDCPCLGGMAHGPCGEEFRAAFSCFVFSEEEPKGMNCIDRFQGMQNCFRAHPDVYAAELEGVDDEALGDGLEEERKDLGREIQERRENAEAAAANSIQAKRLLEEDPPMERTPLLRAQRQPPSLPSNSTPPSSKSHPQTSEDREAETVVSGQPIPTEQQPRSHPSKSGSRSGVPNDNLN